MRSAAIPTIVDAPMSTVSSTIDATLWPRAMNVATVAHVSPASTKNCQAWRPCSDCRDSSVEVSKFIVETFVQLRVDGCGLSRRGMAMSRPSEGHEAHADDAYPAEKVRKQPREAIEAFVDRCDQKLLAAVFPDEAGDDRVVALASFDFRAQV